MTIGINKVILVGFVGAKPEHAILSSGSAAASFSIATTKSWKDKMGQLHENTQWHHIVCYGGKADHVYQFLDKGSLCYVGGKLKTNQWEDENGIRQQRTQIVLREFRCLDRNPDILNVTHVPPPSIAENEEASNEWL